MKVKFPFFICCNHFRGIDITIIWDALRDLIPFVRFKNVKNTHGAVLILACNFTKLTLLHGCFSHFLNCTNGTKLRNAPHI